MNGQRVGYRRVSTVEQHADRQLDGVTLDRMFEDAASGKDVERPQLAALLTYVRDGDVVVVHSMDRLARNLDDLRGLVQGLTVRGVRVEFIKEGLTFTGDDSPMARLLLSLMGAVAEFERALLLERQREGIALAKRRGVYKGRKRAVPEDSLEELWQRASEGESKAGLAREFGVSRQTIYETLRRIAHTMAALDPERKV